MSIQQMHKYDIQTCAMILKKEYEAEPYSETFE